ncbi:MAG TPA: cytochrome c oxidase assembly protein [Candidatus Solibacter sp.]|jgi:putative membrane protein|nr:cytochrome c oxidase assembly protein [Candidatus Solibacter sp.]
MSLQPLPIQWTFDPAIVVGIILAGFAYVYFGRHLDEAGRPWFFWAGLGCFVVALVSPVDYVSDHYLLSVHMLQHILLTMVGPPLVLAGLPPAAGRALPRLLLNPWLTVTLFNVVLLAWHWPSLYNETLLNENLHILEHLMFMATAFLFWWPIVGPGRAGEGMSDLMKIGYLAFAGVPPTVLGMTMAIAPAALYTFYTSAPRLFGDVSVSLDQQLAGILMFGIGNLIYFVPISRIFMSMMEDPDTVPAGT